MSVAEQGLMLFAADKGYLTSLAVEEIGRFESGLLHRCDEHTAFMKDLNANPNFNDDIAAKLGEIIEAATETLQRIVLQLHGLKENLMADTKEIAEKYPASKIPKITSAMEMVAASKMRRVQERMSASRPYAKLW